MTELFHEARIAAYRSQRLDLLPEIDEAADRVDLLWFFLRLDLEMLARLDQLQAGVRDCQDAPAWLPEQVRESASRVQLSIATRQRELRVYRQQLQEFIERNQA